MAGMRCAVLVLGILLCVCCSASDASTSESALWLARVSRNDWLIERSGMDIWECDLSSCVVLVTRDQKQEIERMNVSVIEVLRGPRETANLLRREYEKREVRVRNGDLWTSDKSTLSFYDTFRTYDEIVAFCKSLANLYSSLVEPFALGTTYEGRTIEGYKLSTGGVGKPEIYLEALQHAREWLAPPTLLYTMESLLVGYSSGNSTFVELLDKADWYIVPVVNVDGYIYSWSNDTNARLWRKNRHQFELDVYGVDLNRNWGPEETWCTEGSSTFVTSETYCGEYAFSEPESSAAARFLDSLPNLAAAIDFHCYGSLLLWPWQYSYEHIPHQDYTAYATLGQSMVDAIEDVHGEVFVSEQGSDLYPHSGGLIDYAYSKRNNVFAFTLELRGDSFVVPDSAIMFSATEALQAVITMGEQVIPDQ